MPHRGSPTSSPGIGQRRVFFAFVTAAVVVGVIVRFKGLGKWPFGVDEYYFGQSVQNVLRFGIPAFECGGYYMRGVALQYMAAGLQLLGLSAELAPRAIAAVSSLLALPAVFLLGRRLHGTTVGLLVVALLALSVWEIEMGRFGRFYAPFQAVFLWYLVCFLRYTVDRQRQGLWGMVVLSILAMFVWDGGLLLAVANLLPPFLNHERARLTGSQWRYLAATMGLLLALYWLHTLDFRQVLDGRPPGIDEVMAAARTDAPAEPKQLFSTITRHPPLLLIGLVPLALACWALRWMLRLRDRWLTAIGLIVALGAAILHQFLVVIAVLGLLLLTRMLDWRELFDRRALPFLAAIAVAAVFWLAFGLATASWRHGVTMSSSGVLVGLAYQFLGFPDVLDMVARPWGQAIPILALSILILLMVAASRAIFSERVTSPAERALLVVTLVMLLLVGVANAPRLETRYSFFLYPVLLLIAVTVLFRAVELLARRSSAAPLLATVVVASWFALAEDFQPRHLMNIDSAEINFRQGMKPRVASHYYGRSDIRATAEWLAAHANPHVDLLISGPGIARLDFYYPNLDFVYVDPSDQRLRAWSCQRGTVERWSNLPLVYRPAELEARIQASPRTYLVIDSRWTEDFLPQLQHLEPDIAWVNDYGNHTIVVFHATGASRSTAEPANPQ